MSEETQVATETVSEGTTQEAPTTTPDVGSLIAESKKYRQRSQEAEARLAKLEAKLKQQENDKLKEKEDFKVLAEKLETENQTLSNFKDKYNDMVGKRKDLLLSQIPEKERDAFKDKDLDVLEFMVSNLNKTNLKEPSARGSIKNASSEYKVSDFANMNKQEKKERWASFMNQFKK